LSSSIRIIVSIICTPIVVDPQKRFNRTSHTVLGIAALIALSPLTSVHAGVISAFTDKFKAIFIDSQNDTENTQVLATTQTMALFKPTVVDGTTTDGAEGMVDPDQESLQATAGPLRVSTEDVDFPTSDTVSVYEVKKGDTIQTVAKLFGVSVNTIMWANNLTSRSIAKGDTLVILPITGIKHVVKKGDTLASVAKKYRADAQDIASYNGLSVDATLALGDTVIVPDGEIEIVQSAPAKSKTKTTKGKGTSRLLDSYTYSTPSGFLVRPLVGGTKTQGLHGHNGIDIGAAPGTPVLAAASGRVIVAKMGGYNGGYGNMIIISHDNGVQTVYGHLRDVYVTQGQEVSQGQTIGEVGNTGKSTGPHLHFEVRGAKNPF
jgi:murein DD-endopeptidase MepM/ murein hydrolase activator NlpD